MQLHIIITTLTMRLPGPAIGDIGHYIILLRTDEKEKETRRSALSGIENSKCFCPDFSGGQMNSPSAWEKALTANLQSSGNINKMSGLATKAKKRTKISYQLVDLFLYIYCTCASKLYQWVKCNYLAE